MEIILGVCLKNAATMMVTLYMDPEIMKCMFSIGRYQGVAIGKYVTIIVLITMLVLNEI